MSALKAFLHACAQTETWITFIRHKILCILNRQRTIQSKLNSNIIDENLTARKLYTKAAYKFLYRRATLT